MRRRASAVCVSLTWATQANRTVCFIYSGRFEASGSRGGALVESEVQDPVNVAVLSFVVLEGGGSLGFDRREKKAHLCGKQAGLVGREHRLAVMNF